MAILSYSVDPSKGSTVVATLNKANLFAVPELAADAFWSDPNNTKTVVILLKSTSGNDKVGLVFDCTQSSPTDNLTFPSNCRDMFDIEQVTLVDHLGDVYGFLPYLPFDKINLTNLVHMLVAGNAAYNFNGQYQAVSWLSDLPDLLSPPLGKGQGVVNASTAKDNIAWAVGYSYNYGTNTNDWMIWQNSAIDRHPYIINDGMSMGIMGIAIMRQGNNLPVTYCCGVDTGSSPNIPYYWVNENQPNFLATYTYGGVANGIAIDGTDVYICGYAKDSSSINQAVFWKNEVLFTLDVVTNAPVQAVYGAIAVSIAVDSGNVYIGGIIYGPGYIPRSVVWVNGVITHVLDTSGYVNGSTITNLVVYNGDVYSCGVVYDANYANKPMVWTNQNRSSLAVGYGNIGQASVIRVADGSVMGTNAGDIYVCGYVFDSNFNQSPAVWLNGAFDNSLAPMDTNFYVSGYAASMEVTGPGIFVYGALNQIQSNAILPYVWSSGAGAVLDRVQYPVDANVNGCAIKSGEKVVVGVSYNSPSGESIKPTLWMNGVYSILDYEGVTTDPTTGAEANSVAISGSDVYVAGLIYNTGTRLYEGCVWKNGVRSPLDNSMGPNGTTYINGIYVDGSDVYVVGGADVNDGHPYVPVVWKNGTYLMSIDIGSFSIGTTYGIKVVNGDVYISGTVYDTQGKTHGFAAKNGSILFMADETAYPNGSFVTGLDVDGSDVYICGYAFDQNYALYPVYWKNGPAFQLDFSGYLQGQATQIAIQGGQVHCSGNILDNSSNYHACSWQGTSLQIIYVSPAGADSSYGTCLAFG